MNSHSQPPAPAFRLLLLAGWRPGARHASLRAGCRAKQIRARVAWKAMREPAGNERDC